MIYLGKNAVGISDTVSVVPIDDTAGVGDTTKVWSADKTATETNDLKSALNVLANGEPIPMVYGKYIDLSGQSVTMSDGVPQYESGSTAYSCGMMQCEEDDLFIVSGYGGSSTRLYAFIDSSGTILDVAGQRTYATLASVVAPENAAWIIVHTNDGGISYKGKYINEKITDNYTDIHEQNFVDITKKMIRAYNSYNGVSCTWNGVTATVNGTASGTFRNNVWLYTKGMPEDVKAGGLYYVDYTQGIASGVKICIIWLRPNDEKRTDVFTGSSYVTAPMDALGVTIGLLVETGTAVSNAQVEFHIYTVPTMVSVLNNLIPHNVLTEFGNFDYRNHRSVTYTWNATKEICTINGTATGGVSFDPLILYTAGLPASVEPGKVYQLDFVSSSESVVVVRVYYRHSDNTTENIAYTNSTYLTIPDDCTGITIRIEVPEGSTASNEQINIKLMNNQADVSNGVGNHVSKMLSIGSSFMTGAIYPGGVFDHLCSYDNSPYGNVAIGLGIEEKNVNHIKMSSTGLLYDAGNGSILSLIKTMDLSEYDYLLTQYNRPDLGTYSDNGFPLGDMTSVAGDGSIVGAVLELLSYMKTSNPNSTLILVGAPPSDLREGYCYQDVFTAIYNNGVSIGEADLMLHRLAVREHFIFIDWEDLNLSYYYKDLTCGTNVHPEHDATCRAMGLYLARNCDYSHSLARVLKADMQSS